MSISNYEGRHFYPAKDQTKRKKRFWWYKKKRKRLNGAKNDVNIGAFIPVIKQYLCLRYLILEEDFDSLMYVGRLNRTFDRRDFVDVPNKYRDMKCREQMLRLASHGWIEKFEGHGAKKNRQVQYKFTTKGRILIDRYDKHLLRLEKIPLDPSYSSYEFVTPREKLENKKYKINWYAAILEYNKAVINDKED